MCSHTHAHTHKVTHWIHMRWCQKVTAFTFWQRCHFLRCGLKSESLVLFQNFCETKVWVSEGEENIYFPLIWEINVDRCDWWLHNGLFPSQFLAEHAEILFSERRVRKRKTLHLIFFSHFAPFTCKSVITGSNCRQNTSKTDGPSWFGSSSIATLNCGELYFVQGMFGIHMYGVFLQFM